MAPKIETKAIEPVAVEVKAPDTAKAEDKTAEYGPDTRVESVAQYIDEYDPETAMRMMQAHIRMADDLRRGGVGKWELPPTHRHLAPPAYRFSRLGTMSDVKQRDKILRQKFIAEQMGWKQAPRGTRNSLYLTDGDQGVYMCIAEIVGRQHDEHKKKTLDEINRRRFSRSVNRLPEDLQQSGVSRSTTIERVDVSHGTASIDDFRKMR